MVEYKTQPCFFMGSDDRREDIDCGRSCHMVRIMLK